MWATYPLITVLSFCVNQTLFSDHAFGESRASPQHQTNCNQFQSEVLNLYLPSASSPGLRKQFAGCGQSSLPMGVGWGPRMCTVNKLACDADATDPGGSNVRNMPTISLPS